MFDWIVSWNLTYLVHSTILLAGALVASRLVPSRSPAMLDALWKTALVGGLVTATIQVGLVRVGGVEPLGGAWRLSASGGVPAAALLPVAGSMEAVTPESLPVGVAVESRPSASLEPEAARVLPAESRRRSGAVLISVLMGVWVTGAAGLLLLLGLSWHGLRSRLADRRFLRDGVLASFLERLIERTPKPRPAALAVSERIDMPLAWGLRRREICLPERLVADMPRERQELVLAHELAHHERRDPMWLLAARVLESIWFFQPLNRVARRRLQETAEYLCDDWAVEQTGRPISLARCLTEVAEWRLAATGAWPAPTLAAERSRLARRVTRLLDRAYPLPAVPGPRWLGAAVAVALVAVALLAPGVSAAIEERLPSARPTATAESAPEAPAAPRASKPTEPAPPSPPTPPTRRAAPAPVVPPAPVVLAAREPALAPEAPVAPEVRAPAASNAGWVVLEEELGGFEALVEMEPELEARIEELSARLAELAGRATPSPEALARIEAVSRAISERASSDAARAAQVAHEARIEALAKRLEGSGGDAELESQLGAETRALAEAMRPHAEEMRRLHEELRRELAVVGPEREEMRRLQEELHRELDEHRARIREGFRATAELRRGELERVREEVRRERETLGRLNRDELRRLREEMRDTHTLDRAELDRLRAEIDRFVEEAIEIRRQLDSSLEADERQER